MRSLVCNSDTNAALSAGQFQPYVQFDAALQNQLSDGVRFVPLRRGERLTSLAWTQISVLSGKARLSSTGRTLNDSATRARPFLVSARGDILQALEDSVLVLADCDFIDHLTAWAQLARHAQDTGSAATERWKLCRRAKPFSRMPLELAEAAFSQMRMRRVTAGAEIVRQGVPSKAFYTVWSGEAEVLQQDFNDKAPHTVASLQPGETFGEEALTNGGASRTSVRMLSDGELLELPRDIFLDLRANPPIQEISPVEAELRLDSGWVALDVRFVGEYQDGHVAGALSLPLDTINERAEIVLSRAERYVLMCTSGKRSLAAAVLLAHRGYQVASLKNGLRDTAFDLEKDQLPQNKKAVA